MPLHADLYLDQIDLERYLDAETCQICKVDSLAELVERLRSGQVCPGRCPHWPQARIEAFRMAIDAGQWLPAVASLDVPQPTETGPFDMNEPDADAPLLVTGNSRLTHEVLLAVLSTTTAPIRMLSVDTDGHTVDMALVFGTLTPERIAEAILPGDTRSEESTGRIILPGLAESLVSPVSDMLGRPVEAGPICAAELPLFFSSDWVR